MRKSYRNTLLAKYVFVIIAMAIMVISSIFTNQLASKLSVEETKKIELWAKATKQLILADENTDINFLLNIIEDNTTIPVIMTDENGNILSSRNIKLESKNSNDYLKNLVEKFKNRRLQIEVSLNDNVKQYIYYDESSLLKELQIFPFVQIGVVFVFFIVVILVFSSSKRAEQNRVWVGLSKETAHQLGTPISSLLAWGELLKLKYGNDQLITDMEKDVKRLGIIADRFSKIGSKPNLKPTIVNSTVENAVNYIRNRASNRVKITLSTPENRPIYANLNIPLFEWVIENLCKNAIDAMNGNGEIDVSLKDSGDLIIIDITDTGKGMDRKMYKAIFSPGFTTKERGWGLGLSLAKRIVEKYHNGKIFVKNSEINRGTTFRIQLPIE